MAIRTVTRRCAPDLKPSDYDEIGTILSDYASRLLAAKPSRTAEVNVHRNVRALTARALADIITRTSVETVTYDDERLVSVGRFSRPDAPPGRVEPEYSGTTPESMAAIQRDLK